MRFFHSAILVTTFAIVVSSCKKDNISNPVVAPANIQTYFKFNGNLTDSTGNIATATTTGTITYGNDRNGNAGNALVLDGASKIIFPGLVIKGQSMTMSAWIKYGTPGAGLQIVLTAFSAAGAGPAMVQLSNKLGLSVSVPSTNTAVSSDVDAAWHHLATTYDGINIKVYVDGMLASTISHPGSMSDGARDMVLGFFSGSYWKGSIDELRIYNTVKTAAEIQQLAAL